MHSETHSLYHSFTRGREQNTTDGMISRSEGVVFPLKEEPIFFIMSLGMEIINKPVMPTGQTGGKTEGKV